jgi:ARG/rhodanese/phosphatase superfamily protein
MKRTILTVLALIVLGAIAATSGPQAHDALHVLVPITHGNLTIFPVIGGYDYDTSRLLTLDEGVRAGSVVVTEQGAVQGLIRRGRPVRPVSSASVNQLVLVNNSDRPLLLLAGEIVTGGKQDRVIGSDRLVPPNSDPINLSVFCVEPGRWVAQSNEFGSMKSQMAQPSVRVPAMALRDQQKVWNEVASADDVLKGKATAVGGSLPDTFYTSSYARTMAAPQIQQTIDRAAGNYDDILRELRRVKAKGVVVAINGRLVWADLFASNDLLSRYWQKLARSYAAESLTNPGPGAGRADQKAAQAFVDRLTGNHEVVETEPGIFRRAEVTGEGYKVFTLTNLMAKSDFEVHVAKMSYDKETWQMRPDPRAIE